MGGNGPPFPPMAADMGGNAWGGTAPPTFRYGGDLPPIPPHMGGTLKTLIHMLLPYTSKQIDMRGVEI